MDRLKLWWLPVYAVIGFIAIVLIVPSSRWVIRTQLDVVEGYWKYKGGPNNGLLPYYPYVYPIERGLNEDDPGQDELARFLRLVTPSKDVPGPNGYQKRLVSLFDICKVKNDVRYWAQFVRVASFSGQIKYTLPGQIPMTFLDNLPVQTRLRDGCLDGIKLDPDNAFFRMILAGVLNRLGDINGSRRAYLRAGTCTKYDDYVLFEPESRMAYLVDHYGDRGHQVKAMIYAETYLQHLSVLHSIGRHFTQPKDLQGRLSTLRLGALIMEQDKSAIGVIVARKLVEWALDPRSRSKDDPKYTVGAMSEVVAPEESVAKLSTQLQKHLGGDFGISHGVDVYNSVHIEEKDWPISEDVTRLMVNLRPAFSAWSLWSLAMVPLALGFLKLRLRSDRFNTAAPYLIWLMAFASEHAFGSNFNVATPFGLMSLLFIPALFPKSVKYVDRIAIFALVLVWVVSFACFPLGIPTVLFTVSLIATRRFGSLPNAATIVGLLIACVVAAGYWLCIATQHGFGDAAAFGTLVIIGAFPSIPVRSSIRWAPLVGASCLVLGLWFGVMVARDLSADQVMLAMSNKFLNDADELRKR